MPDRKASQASWLRCTFDEFLADNSVRYLMAVCTVRLLMFVLAFEYILSWIYFHDQLPNLCAFDVWEYETGDH